MSIQNPATHAIARQQASYRYEAARRDLSRTIDQRLSNDTRLATSDGNSALQRKVTMDRTAHMLVPLSRFIKGEIRRFSDRGEIEAGIIDEHDVLMTAIIEAAEQLGSQQETAGFYPWIRRVSQKQIRKSVRSEAERVATERSLDAPVRIAGEDWPDRVLLLREVLADPGAVLPEAVVERNETWALLEYALDELPERWREVFLLRSVDAWDDEEIAAAEGIDVADVEVINVAARAYLRENLRDSELLNAE